MPALHCGIPGVVGPKVVENTFRARLVLLSFLHPFLFLFSYLLLPCQLLKVLLESLVIRRMHRFSLWYELLLQVDLLLDPVAIVRFDISQIVMLALGQAREVARVICGSTILEGAGCVVLCLSFIMSAVVSSGGVRWHRFGSGVQRVGSSLLSCRLRVLS